MFDFGDKIWEGGTRRDMIRDAGLGCGAIVRVRFLGLLTVSFSLSALLSMSALEDRVSKIDSVRLKELSTWSAFYHATHELLVMRQ